jgi:hypothetical protein
MERDGTAFTFLPFTQLQLGTFNSFYIFVAPFSDQEHSVSKFDVVRASVDLFGVFDMFRFYQKLGLLAGLSDNFDKNAETARSHLIKVLQNRKIKMERRSHLIETAKVL